MTSINSLKITGKNKYRRSGSVEFNTEKQLKLQTWYAAQHRIIFPDDYTVDSKKLEKLINRYKKEIVQTGIKS